MLGALTIGGAVVTALLAAASLRLQSLVSTLLAAYLVLVAEAVVLVLALSPFRQVRHGTLAAGTGALLVAAALAWWWRGRPGLPLATAMPAARRVARSPITLLFAAVALAVLAYELLLGLTVPPNNWDSLTYHLARVAAWHQHGGVYWIPNAPTGRLNEFQPLAEQLVLFLFTASGRSNLFALPQWTAEIAILVAVYGACRRLGYSAPVATCAASLLATFSLVALESTTAQNDLVAASFPAVAVCLVLGTTRTELLLGGAALGVGLGAKLTTALVWPVVALLVISRGRRAARLAAAGACAGLAVAGVWGFALNLANSGRLLGSGFGDNVSAASFPGSPTTAVHVLYRMLDLSALSDRLIGRLAIAALVAGALAAVYGYRRGGPRRAALAAVAVAVPLAAPLLVIGASDALAWTTRQLGFAVRVRGEAGWNRRANEDYSAFGPVGALMLIGVPVLTIVLFLLRRADVRHLALALALPVFLILLGSYSAYNSFLTRFLLVPAVLTAPLFGVVLRNRGAGWALLAVASIAVLLTLKQERTKPYVSAAEHPWHMTQAEALDYVFDPAVAPAYSDFMSDVPEAACVGAVLGPDEPGYLLYGPGLRRKVYYLPAEGALPSALLRRLYYVVVSARSDAPTVDQFTGAGWSERRLGSYWLLATAPRPVTSGC